MFKIFLKNLLKKVMYGLFSTFWLYYPLFCHMTTFFFFFFLGGGVIFGFLFIGFWTFKIF